MASIEVREERVTPKVAATWLAKNNIKNRRLRNRHVSMLASDMSTGRWRTTHEAIAFDSTGRLIDGQHRLAAVVKSGRVQSFLVARNLAKGTQLFVDNGCRRSLADAATFEGDLSITSKTEAVCRAAVDPFLSCNVTRMDLLARYKRHQEAIEWAVSSFKGCPQAVKSSAVMGVFVRAYYGGDYNRSRLDEMTRCMRHGELDGAKDRAAARLRDYLLRSKSDGKSDRREAIRYADYCISKFLNRDSRVRAKPSAKDKLTFPLPEERAA